MSLKSQVLWATQIIAAIAVVVAAIDGGTAIRSNGLHVQKLAYDAIGLTFCLVSFASCLVASVSLNCLVHFWKRQDAFLFSFACVVAGASASAFANAGREFNLNGSSPEWISWAVAVWVVALFCILIFTACSDRQTSG